MKSANMSHISTAFNGAEIPPQLVLRATLARDFCAFIEFTFGVLRPGTPFRPNWHIEAMAHKLAQIESGQIKRLIITLPPRNLKSICASVALPAWFLGHHPSERVVAVSYSDSLAKTHANDFRKIVSDPIYQATFPAMRVSRDTDSEIHTTLRGRRYATSIEGTLTGRGGNLVIIDDPLKPNDAHSEAARTRSIEWYRSTLVTRPDDKMAARIVVVMQRVHEEDLVGYLLEQGGFEVLNLPAIAQSDASYELGAGGIYTRRKGELLHPAHEPAEVLRDLKKSMGSYAFSAQYQQSPIPPGGRIIKKRWFKRYGQLSREPRDRILISWDIALSETEAGDFSVGVVLLCREETFYVLDVVRGKFPFDQLKRKIIEQKQIYPGSTLLIEDSPISHGLIQSLQESRINVVTFRPDRDKRARVISQSDLFEGGSVFFPENAPWLEDLENELLAFPGRHDDQVDALIQGMAWQREGFGFVRSGRTIGII
jgi:predicted phage terminase large subunit-like protein